MMLERGVCGRVWDSKCTKKKGYFYYFSLRKEGKAKYRGK